MEETWKFFLEVYASLCSVTSSVLDPPSLSLIGVLELYIICFARLAYLTISKTFEVHKAPWLRVLVREARMCCVLASIVKSHQQTLYYSNIIAVHAIEAKRRS